ncbi:MAG: saccharopine dehydrogenase C-terminal domain-containing protein [bacterium]|nr:saccharopine dehydrogenase C-terminal domain-containing protein [bacterium]
MILLLGAGRQGYITLETLLELGFKEVLVVEKDLTNAKRAKKLGVEVVEAGVGEINLESYLNRVVLVVNCLPARFGFKVFEHVVNKGVNIVDITYMEENPLTLDKVAKKNGVSAFVDAGFAPGISNFLVGYGLMRWGPVEKITIKVGGIPAHPLPPFNYRITWSFEDLIEEYTRPARIKRQGKVVTLPALSGLETDIYSGIGALEAFYTDGLRTLLETIDVKDMEEKTLRYPGHAEIFRVLRDIGLFNKNESIYGHFKDWLCRKLTEGDEEDVAILRVEFYKEHIKKGFEIIHYYNKGRKRTAMSELTGIPPAIVVKMFLNKSINLKGVLPLERLGMDEKIAEEFLRMLSQFCISVKEF